MSPADKRYLDVNKRRDKISRRYAREDADMNQVYVPSSLTPIDLSGFEGEE